MAKLKLLSFRKPEHPVSGRTRKTVLWHRLLRSFLHLIAWIFLVLTVIGNVSNKPVLRDTYFLKIDLTDIVPIAVPNSRLINSIARTIGLHDFYQVGLWNFCEGYQNTGITHCSHPKSLYYFNPVKILLSELLAGASIALPADISDALAIVRLASYWMFGLFMVSAVLTFVLIFLTPLAVSSRPPQSISPDPQVNQSHPPHRRRFFVLLRAFPFLVIVFLNALFTIVAAIVATVMFSIFKNVFISQADLNIKASLGAQMMAFMWIAAAFNFLAFVVQLGSCCAACCAACCGGRKARKQLKHGGHSTGEMREKNNPHNEPMTNSNGI